MANVFTFYFKGADLKALTDLTPDYVLVSAEIKTGAIGGVDVGVLVVSADAYMKGGPSMATKPGCPVPPCVPNKMTIVDSNCALQAEQLIQSYVSNNLI